MDDLTLPYHLVILAILCVVALGLIFLYRKVLFIKNKLLWSSVIIFLVIYLLIVGGSVFDAIYYQWDLNRYDLNKDGLFSDAEITDKQNEAMRNLTSDTGRNLSFITGFVFAFIISTLVYVGGRIITKLKVIDDREEN